MAHIMSSPPEMLETAASPVTGPAGCGTVLPLVPLPRLPQMLVPQHHKLPLEAITAHVNSSGLALTALAGPGNVLTVTGVAE